MDSSFSPVGFQVNTRAIPISPSAPHLNRKPVHIVSRPLYIRTDPLPRFQPSGTGRDMFCSRAPPSSYNDSSKKRGIAKEIPVVYADTISQRQMALSGKIRASTPFAVKQQAAMRRAQSASSLRLSSTSSTALMRTRKRDKFVRPEAKFDGAAQSRRSIFSDHNMLARTLHCRPAGC